VGAWILRGHLQRTGNFKKAVSDYHSRKKEFGRRYLGQVLARAPKLDVAKTLARANQPFEKARLAKARAKERAQAAGEPDREEAMASEPAVSKAAQAKAGRPKAGQKKRSKRAAR
jgi:hypothetical protein